ncbi:hypothetical protein XM47_10405 [Catenovulum maritimum]|uniref:Major facilitator superfamily (MFS) profile domain-containing protein n=1 Tax=Catenovulum maritimum TaxID=1513271 RepID=A0A0J8JKU9_9ALTE|nr:hypothetical protein XM47_10405 [Catenovulum maritimum]
MNSDKTRLSQVYFAYFAILGVVSHYLGLYLHHLNLEPSMIGLVLAVMTIGRIAGPMVWANLPGLQSSPSCSIQSSCFLALISFSILLFSHEPSVLMLALGGFAFFWSAALPQLESVAQSCLKGNASAYSMVRIWGSISFICLVIIAGWFFEIYGIVFSVEMFTIGLLTLLFISSFRLPEADLEASDDQVYTGTLAKLKQANVMAFMFASFLLQLSFATYYGFFSIYLTELGYTGYQIGIMISVGVIAEIGIFLIAGRILNRYSLKALFLFCLLITSFRWFGISLWGENIALLFLLQIIHAFSYGLFHVAAQKFIHVEFKGKGQAKGQALYMSLSFGIGGALGSVVSGYSWEFVGQQTFALSALLALVAALLILMFYKTIRVQDK